MLRPYIHTGRLGVASLEPALPLLERSRPILLQEPRHGAVGEYSSIRLAAWAVVHLALRVPNALHRRTAHGAGLAVAAVYRHLGPEGGHLLGKPVSDLGAQALDPCAQRFARGAIEPLDVGVGQTRGQREWREPRGVQDLVRIRVADAAEDRGVR